MFTKKKTCGVCGYRVTPTKEEIYVAEEPGAFIRCEHQGWGGKIIRIGNLIKDKWFSLEAFFKEVKEAGGGE